MRPRRNKRTLGSLFSRPLSVVVIGLLTIAASVLLWRLFVAPGLPVLLFELGARPDSAPGRIQSTSVTRGYRSPPSFHATITYRSTTTEVTTNRTAVFAKLHPGENVEVKLIGGQPVEFDSPDGDLLLDDALAWDLAVPGTVLTGVLLIALGFHFRRDVRGWWRQIDGERVDPARFGPAIRWGLTVAAGLLVAGLAIGLWNGVTGASPAPVVAPPLAVVAITLLWRALRWLDGVPR